MGYANVIIRAKPIQFDHETGFSVIARSSRSTIFNPDDWAGFSLQSGIYQPIVPNTKSQLVSQALGLALLRWQGSYKGVNTTWLRWATLAGELLPTTDELAYQERQRAEQERQRAERAESQLQQVARNLLQSGMTVEQVANITGLKELAIEELSN